MYSYNNIPSGYNRKTRTNSYPINKSTSTRKGGCSSCQKAREAYQKRVQLRQQNKLG